MSCFGLIDKNTDPSCILWSVHFDRNIFFVIIFFLISILNYRWFWNDCSPWICIVKLNLKKMRMENNKNKTKKNWYLWPKEKLSITLSLLLKVRWYALFPLCWMTTDYLASYFWMIFQRFEINDNWRLLQKCSTK